MGECNTSKVPVGSAQQPTNNLAAQKLLLVTPSRRKKCLFLRYKKHYMVSRVHKAMFRTCNRTDASTHMCSRVDRFGTRRQHMWTVTSKTRHFNNITRTTQTDMQHNKTSVALPKLLVSLTLPCTPQAGGRGHTLLWLSTSVFRERSPFFSHVGGTSEISLSLSTNTCNCRNWANTAGGMRRTRFPEALNTFRSLSGRTPSRPSPVSSLPAAVRYVTFRERLQGEAASRDSELGGWLLDGTCGLARSSMPIEVKCCTYHVS